MNFYPKLEFSFDRYHRKYLSQQIALNHLNTFKYFSFKRIVQSEFIVHRVRTSVARALLSAWHNQGLLISLYGMKHA